MRAALGEPIEIAQTPDGQRWRYFSVRTAISTERFLFMPRRHFFTEEQELNATINTNGVIVAHTFMRDSYRERPRRSLAGTP